MNKHKVTLRILESLELGKRTREASGIEIDIYGTSETERKLGTISMGRGTIAWYTKNAWKQSEKGGKHPPTIKFSLTQFAALLDTVGTLGLSKAMRKLLKKASDDKAS